MAGSPKRRAKRLAQALKVAEARLKEAGIVDHQIAEVSGSANDDAEMSREQVQGWWRGQMELVQRVTQERSELLSVAGEHPSAIFANQALQFGAMGMPKDVAATLLGLSEAQLQLYYGQEYALGAAHIMGQVAVNLLRIATSTNDRHAVKAAVEVMHRRGGDEWRPPAQKLEVSRPEGRGNLIDSSKLTREERAALRAIIERAAARPAGLLPSSETVEEQEDGE